MMRLIGLVVLAGTLSGCVSAPSYTCDEACAIKDMACTGQTLSTSDSVIRNNSSLFDWSQGSSYTATYQCVKDPSQESKIYALKMSLIREDVEAEYQSKCFGINAVVNPGYQRACAKIREELKR